MSAMPMKPIDMEPTQSVKDDSSSKKDSIRKFIIVVCVLNSIILFFTVLSIIFIVRMNYGLLELSDVLSHKGKNSRGSTDSGTAQPSDNLQQVGSKSFIINGRDTKNGFNITVEFPKCGSFEYGEKLLVMMKLIQEMHDNLESRKGAGCPPSTGNFLKDIHDSLVAIKSNQGIIMSKSNGTSGFSQTAAFQRIESTLVQQTQLVQNRIGDMENVIIQTKSQINSFQKSLSDIKTGISKIKLDDGMMKLDVASIKAKLDSLSAKSNCADDFTPILTTLKKDVQRIDMKSDKMQQDVSSLIKGDKSLTSVSNTLSDRIGGLETSSSEMKDKCKASEIKLAEVLAKVGVPSKPPTSPFAQVAISYCSRYSGCKSVSVATTHCYKVSDTTNHDWTEAREQCKRIGGYLAEIDSETESREVAAMIKRKGLYWIGGTDLAENKRWQWNYSGRTISMSAWREDNPSVINHYSCMSIADDAWSWRSEQCNTPAGYICEKEANDCKDWMQL